MAEERKALHAYVSLPAHEAWHQFARDNGVSVSGLFEVMGQDLAEADLDEGELSDAQQGWIKRARKIDAQRRRRA